MIKNISGKDTSQIQNSQNTPSPKIDKRDPKMLEAARAFENQFIRQIISEMRKTIPKDELIPESMTENIFKDQLDGEYANSWVQNGGIGLADIIYDQLEQKYGAHPVTPSHTPRELLPLPKSQGLQAASPDRPRDILDRTDKDLFLAKRTESGFDIRSREPLPERVSLKAPLSGLVLQSQSLDDGRQLLVIKHDQGLVSQFVHTGRNNVKMNTRVAAGDVIAELPASQRGESAHVVFGLRKAADLE